MDKAIAHLGLEQVKKWLWWVTIPDWTSEQELTMASLLSETTGFTSQKKVPDSALATNFTSYRA